MALKMSAAFDDSCEVAFSVMGFDMWRSFEALERNWLAVVGLGKRALMAHSRSCGLPQHFHTR
jgi:hypothetical protein